MGAIKLYLHSMRMLLRSQWQYRASFLMQTASQLLMEAGEFLAVILVIDRFDGLNQWSGSDILVFFGMMSVVFYTTEIFFRGITGNFQSLVRTGMLDTMLARPRGVLTQVLCSATDPRRIGAIAIGATALVMGFSQTDIAWNGLKTLAFAETLIFGVMLVVGLFLIEAMFTIHSVKSIELVNALTYGGRSACQYPIDVYPKPLKVLFMYIAPFALVFHAPISYLLDKNLYGMSDALALLCPLAGGVFFLAMYALFRYELKYYTSTGS